MKLPLLLTLALLPSLPAFASLSYQPKGKEISLAQAAQEMVTKDDAQYTFDHGKLYVEFKDTYARAASVDELEAAVAKIATNKTYSDRVYGYTVGWNQIGEPGLKPDFDIFANLRQNAKDSLDQPIAQTPDDLFQSVITIYTDTYLPETVVGPIASVLHTNSGYSGGAHDWVGVGFETHSQDSFGPATLIDILDNTDLLRALKADPYLRKIAKEAGKLAEFGKVSQLTDFAALCANMTFGGSEPVEWTIEPLEQFQKFAIWDYDVKSETATIRIGLEYNSEANRGQFEQLSVRVKVKPEAAVWMKAAKESGKAIFMKDVKPASAK